MGKTPVQPIGSKTANACRLVLLAAVMAASGCTSLQGVREYIAYNDTTNDFVLGWRNSVWARQAWHERKWQFVDEPQFVAFGDGFRSGYEDVASGGNGCPPPLPPRRYWNWKYQSPEGQAKTAAWFTGYPYGARAAEEDGAGLYQQIQVSHQIERQYSPEFLGLPTPLDVPPGTPIPTIPVPSAEEVVPTPIRGASDPPPPVLDMSNRTRDPQLPRAVASHWPSSVGPTAIPYMEVGAAGIANARPSEPRQTVQPVRTVTVTAVDAPRPAPRPSPSDAAAIQ